MGPIHCAYNPVSSTNLQVNTWDKLLLFLLLPIRMGEFVSISSWSVSYFKTKKQDFLKTDFFGLDNK